MNFLKYIGIFFLVYSLIEVIIGMINIKNEKISNIDALGGYLVGSVIGGLWLYLLIQLIKSVI